MAGRKVEFDMTYLTEARIYRNGIVAADQSALLDANSAAIPDIRLDIDYTKEVHDAAALYAPQHEVTARAYNGHLELFVYYTPGGEDCQESSEGLVPGGLLDTNDTRCHADIRVWAYSGPYNDSSAVPCRWCLYHEQSVMGDTLIPLRNIPNTKYRVAVSFINGGSVDIIEQHTL